jgi:hypothetical protein
MAMWEGLSLSSMRRAPAAIDCIGDSGHFIRKSRAGDSFREAFAALMRGGLEFTPPFQPNLVAMETEGLPREIVDAANNGARRRAEVPSE